MKENWKIVNIIEVRRVRRIVRRKLKDSGKLIKKE